MAKMGNKSCVANYFRSFWPILMKLAQMFALGCRCARHIFDSGRKCCHGNGIFRQNGGKILRRELLPQFFANSHEIWHRCLPWGVDVQDTFFDSGRKCVAMVTAYYGKNGKILRRELLPQFFTNSHEIWHRCLSWGVDVQDTFFFSLAESVLPW